MIRPNGIYQVHLLTAEPPVLDLERLLPVLKERCGRVDVVSQDDEQDKSFTILTLAYPDLAADGLVPPASVFGCFAAAPTGEDLDTALQQTWQWKAEATEAVSRCQGYIMVNDMLGRLLPHQQRMEWLYHLIESLLDQVDCHAIHWVSSSQVVNPEIYQAMRRQQPPHPLYGAVNVRLFNIGNGQPGEVVMDTLGLAALGLPDVQCHFINLDLNAVANLLYNLALYLFQQGDIIDDGNTVEGLQPGSKWVCQHEEAIVAPQREVLDVNPGKPYAAGNR